VMSSRFMLNMRELGTGASVSELRMGIFYESESHYDLSPAHSTRR
jgi:hypothetical protein